MYEDRLIFYAHACIEKLNQKNSKEAPKSGRYIECNIYGAEIAYIMKVTHFLP